MRDISAMKLGKKPAVFDSRVPRLAGFLVAAMTFPLLFDAVGGKGIAWGMMLNDTLGCCTIAGVGHKVQADTFVAGKIAAITDAEIEKKYEQWDGFVPGDPSTDQGGIEADVLAAWLKEKDGFFEHHLVAYGYVNHDRLDEVCHFCAELNGLYIGIALPISAQAQTQNKHIWDVTNASLTGDSAPGGWGGHAVYVYGYTSDAQGNLLTVKFISWGMEMEMTGAFWKAYVDEAWGVLTAAYVRNGKLVGSSLDVAAVEREMPPIRMAA